MKNNSGGFRTVNLNDIYSSEKWTFSGGYVVLFDCPLLQLSDRDNVAPYFERPKDNNYTHVNLTTVFYVVKTKLEKTEEGYMPVGPVSGVEGKAYWAHYDIYAIKYPEMTPLLKHSIDVRPPNSKGWTQEVSGDDWYVAHTIGYHQSGQKSELQEL